MLMRMRIRGPRAICKVYSVIEEAKKGMEGLKN
jgi:hypothetical protein